MQARLSRSGQLTVADIRRFVRKERSSMIGPTALYYAGVTAPMITASLATLVAAALAYAGWSTYWSTMSAAIIACLGGITWYLIFMRWAYRSSYGRAYELNTDIVFDADENGVSVVRSGLRMQATWSAVSLIKHTAKYTALIIEGGGNILLPASWFENADEHNAFHERLIALKDANTKEAEVFHG